VANKRPNFPDAQYSLAAVYARIKRVPEPVDLLEKVIKANPEHFGANLLLGRILSLENIPNQTLPNLQKAVEVHPDSLEAHLFLAQADAQLGRQQDAMRERSEADRLRSANPQQSRSD